MRDILITNIGTGYALIPILDEKITALGKEARTIAAKLRAENNHAEAEFQGNAFSRGIGFLTEIRNQIAVQCGENVVAVGADSPGWATCPRCGRWFIECDCK